MDDYKSLLSGFISGIIHTIIGYPLDTIKTYKQSNVIIKNNHLYMTIFNIHKYYFNYLSIILS